MALSDTRREYSLGGLDRDDLAADPLAQFTRWFGDASASRGGSRLRRIGIALYDLWHAVLGHPPVDVNAMVLATADRRRRAIGAHRPAQGRGRARLHVLHELRQPQGP